jgi:hypothetical protein
MQLKKYLADWSDTLSFGSNDLAKHRYYEFVQHHYQSALKKMFSRFGDELQVEWGSVADRYYRDYPPESYELNRLTFSFPDFVKNNSVDFNWPLWAFDLSQYELAEFIVFTDEKNIKLGNGSSINPTLLLLEFEYDIPRWLISQERGENGVILRNQHILAVARNPLTHLCQFTQVNNEILQILRQIDSQLPISSMNPTIKFMQQQSILI